MKLSEKEQNYLKKVLGSEKGLELDSALSVLNKKRGDSEQLSLNDISDALEVLFQDDTASAGKGVETDSKDNQIVKRHLDSLNKLKEEEAFEKDIEKMSAIARKVLLDNADLLSQIVAHPAPRFYEILSGKTQAVLNAAVHNKIQQGWIPLGGVSAAAFGISPVGGNQYIQAMVKY
jgi:hypothetical protein